MRERNFGFILRLAVLVFCLLFSFLDSSNSEEDVRNRQTYVIRYKDGEQTIPVTVVLDYKKQTEYVINMNPRTPAKSVTLYDFKQRTIAYKDLTNKECFLGRLTHENLNEENNALQDVKNPVEVHPKVRSLDPRKPALTPTEIRNIAGQKTAVFCRKMNTWLLMPEKTHNIGKREADDEYEERTFQYHGHRLSQYSHYERETRRRFRNGGQENSRRRSQRKQSEVDNRNKGHPFPGPNADLPHLRNQSSNTGSHSNPGRSTVVSGTNIESHEVNHRPFQTSYSWDQRNLNSDKENHEIPFSRRFPSDVSNLDQNLRNPGFPNAKTRLSSLANANTPSTKSIYNQSNNFNLNESDENSIYDHETVPGFSKHALSQHKSNSPLERLTSNDRENADERPTTTNAPFIPYGQPGYPNVHSSLVHLLPLYKPLSEEFDFDQKTGTEKPQPNQERNIESESHPLSTSLIKPPNRLNHLVDEHNTPHNPDVSINVLEIPRITKEFENIKGNETYIPSSDLENSKLIHTPLVNYPSLSQTPVQSDPSPYYQRTNFHHPPEYSPISSNNVVNNALKGTYFKENGFYNPYSEVTTATEFPVLTTPKYSPTGRTAPHAFYPPPIHTAFKNSEDIDTFQIYPNYIENGVGPVDKTNFSVHATRVDRHKLENQDTRIPEHLILTTEYPFRENKHETDANQRSDNPNENNIDELQFKPVATDKRINAFPILNNSTDESIPIYNKRYQNVLRDFKPDEILIDIGNVPTHTPTPFTDSFHQKIPTTIQPTITSISPNDTKKYTDRRSEQNSGAIWRSSYPATRYSRRRIHEKPHRPVKNTPLLPTQRGSLNENYYPSSQVNQFAGVNQFSSVHQRNHRQFYSPNRPIPPPRSRVPSELNHLHHINHLGNLPPGVSVHPRHPQAPLADMVHSNRPPTIPLANDDQSLLKPHRQRHHRKKEKHPNSCCRLQGQSSAYQSCCRNGGGPCCSRSRRRMHPPGAAPCCSSSNAIGQIISPNRIQPPIATANQILPPIRTEKTHRSEVDNKDRCQKEKMCRTLYESTQQVMVCRNADVEGC